MTVSKAAVVPREPAAPPADARLAESPWWRRALLFGTGVGIAISDKDLEVAIVRSRPAGSRLAASIVIRDFRTRPAAEWGAEPGSFLAAAGERGAAATLVLPWGAAVESALRLPGVADKDVPGAIELQLETLHPYGDEEVAWAWSRASRSDVLVGVVRQSVLENYETLFSEAGIRLVRITFSSAAIHAAIRARTAAPASFLAIVASPGGARTDIYGESATRGVYSARYPFAPERAIEFAREELRLDAATAALDLAGALPVQAAETAQSPIAVAAALAASAPFFARWANLLPPERRAARSRRAWIAAAAAAVILMAAAIAVWVVLPAIEQHRYTRDLAVESRALEAPALRAQTLQNRISSARARVAAIDDLRRRPQDDLEVLNELTRLLPAQAWANTVEIYPDSVVISGEADQAASLVKLLDSSPLFQNSEFTLTHAGQMEQFRIRTMRRGRMGRTTP